MEVFIQLTKDSKELTVMIEDNGQGFDKTLLTNSKGNGWRNMNSRLELINGTLEIETSPSQKGNALIANVNLQ